LTRPSVARVEIQPIGLGATIALNGSRGSSALSRPVVSYGGNWVTGVRKAA
jgi:hypothetical protein